MPARLRKGLILIPLAPHTANQTEASQSDPPPFPCCTATHARTQRAGDPDTGAGLQERTPRAGTAWARAARGAAPAHPERSSNAEQHGAWNLSHTALQQNYRKSREKKKLPYHAAEE